MVDVGCTAVGQAARSAAVEQRLDVARPTGERQRAGVVAGDRDRLAAAERERALRARTADAQGADRNRKGHRDRQVERAGFGVRDNETAADVAGLIFHHSGPGRRLQDSGVVDARGEDAHRGGRDVAGDVAGRGHGGAVPVVSGARDRTARDAGDSGIVHQTAVGAGLQCAGRFVAQPVVGNDLDLIDRIAVAAEGHGQPGQCRVDLGTGAAQRQEVACAVVVAVDGHAAQRTGADRHARVVAGAEGVATGIEQAHGDLQEVRLSRLQRVQLGIGHGEPRHRVVGTDGAVDCDRTGRPAHHRRIVGRDRVDPELVVRLLLVAVAEAEAEAVARRIAARQLAIAFVAVVDVVDASGIDVSLREGRADAQRLEGGAAVGR